MSIVAHTFSPTLSQGRGGTLRFTTAGSVDDGKSTLIGRLLLDAKGLLHDQVAAATRASARRGASLDLSLFTDGLTIEREQGITVDVAYRYFATPRRRFIIADTPGHEQYTRNMVTGSSNADLSVILVDAQRGVSRQTRRHAALAALLGIPEVVLAVNKMDAVGFDRAVFDDIVADFAAVAHALGLRRHLAIPLSALEGDMVVDRGGRLGWYEGPTLLEVLEAVNVRRGDGALRFPVQRVSHSRFGAARDLRGFQGRVESGRIAVGDAVVAWPSRLEARVAQILGPEGTLSGARRGQSVIVVLDRQVDVARGDLLSHAARPPALARHLDVSLAWLDHEPLEPARGYLLKHTTQTVKARVEELESRLDLVTLQPDRAAATLGPNDLGRARIAVARPLIADTYADDRATGSFILIDESSNRTVAGGIIHGWRQAS
jgi:sulfate adenylyltransferase subunit 1